MTLALSALLFFGVMWHRLRVAELKREVDRLLPMALSSFPGHELDDDEREIVDEFKRTLKAAAARDGGS